MVDAFCFEPAFGNGADLEARPSPPRSRAGPSSISTTEVFPFGSVVVCSHVASYRLSSRRTSLFSLRSRLRRARRTGRAETQGRAVSSFEHPPRGDYRREPNGVVCREGAFRPTESGAGARAALRSPLGRPLVKRKSGIDSEKP